VAEKESDVTMEQTDLMARGRPARLSRRLLTGLAAALALLAIGAVVVVQSRDDAPPKAEEVATDFLQAYGALDAEQAITYLADDADVSQMISSVGASEGTFRLLVSLLEAEGYKQTLSPCEELIGSASGTYVRCMFDFHAIRSDEIGRGPFSGSYFDLTVRGGKVVRASQTWAIDEFSPQMWEPFANWVSKAHRKDAAVMYENDTHSGIRLTEESIRLWERHTRGYVDEVKRRRDAKAA
jgi:NAD(P)-dependent dehydrogenase (short-subunit alcohol dehydrogenase family)